MTTFSPAFIDNRIFIVVAAYNEASVIGETIGQLTPLTSNIIVVDDCSHDATSQIALATGVHVLRHPINLGQGAALQTGIEYALALGAEYIVTFDADGQHMVGDMLPMLEALKLSKTDIALGSRFLGSTRGLPTSRRLMLKAAIAFTRLTGGGRFSDVHNGYRIMTRHFANHFKFQQNRMAHASEILTYITKNNIQFIEFPVTVTYSPHSLKSGQRNSNSLRIVMELILGRVSK